MEPAVAAKASYRSLGARNVGIAASSQTALSAPIIYAHNTRPDLSSVDRRKLPELYRLEAAAGVGQTPTSPRIGGPIALRWLGSVEGKVTLVNRRPDFIMMSFTTDLALSRGLGNRSNQFRSMARTDSPLSFHQVRFAPGPGVTLNTQKVIADRNHRILG